MSLVYTPRLIHVNRNARCGHVPSALMWRELIACQNHLTAFRHRQVYSKSLELGTDTTGATSLGGRWRFRTGYGVSHCKVVLVMGLCPTVDGIGFQTNPTSSVALTISGGATTTVTFNYGASVATATDAPDEQMVMAEDVAVTENTVYECLLSNAELARPTAILVYEYRQSTTVTESVSYFNTHSPTGGSPILDADRERLFLGLSNMYRRNGAINAHWSLFDGSARTRSSATHISAIDNATTGTPTAGTHAGFYVNAQYHNTMSRTTVPFEFACYASMSAGTGTVRLIDSSGNTYGSCSVSSATPAWVVGAAVSLPTSEVFLVPQYAGDGAGTLSLYACSLIETE